MRVEFGTNKLERAYEDPRYAVRLWGPEVGGRYIARVQFIEAATNFDAVKAMTSFHAHELVGELAGLWALTLIGRWRLLLELPATENLATVKEVSNHYGD